jgi:hypothetical protein
MASCQAVSAGLPPTIYKIFYYSGHHVLREKNVVQVNLEPET